MGLDINKVKEDNICAVTAESLINSLLINDEYAYAESGFTNKQIYDALKRCDSLLYIPLKKDSCPDYAYDFSLRQIMCAESTVELIARRNFNAALHELEDSIDNLNRNRVLTANEIVLYRILISGFIMTLITVFLETVKVGNIIWYIKEDEKTHNHYLLKLKVSKIENKFGFIHYLTNVIGEDSIIYLDANDFKYNAFLSKSEADIELQKRKTMEIE